MALGQWVTIISLNDIVVAWLVWLLYTCNFCRFGRVVYPLKQSLVFISANRWTMEMLSGVRTKS